MSRRVILRTRCGCWQYVHMTESLIYLGSVYLVPLDGRSAVIGYDPLPPPVSTPARRFVFNGLTDRHLPVFEEAL